MNAIVDRRQVLVGAGALAVAAAIPTVPASAETASAETAPIATPISVTLPRHPFIGVQPPEGPFYSLRVVYTASNRISIMVLKAQPQQRVADMAAAEGAFFATFLSEQPCVTYYHHE